MKICIRTHTYSSTICRQSCTSPTYHDIYLELSTGQYKVFKMHDLNPHTGQWIDRTPPTSPAFTLDTHTICPQTKLKFLEGQAAEELLAEYLL